MYGHDNLEVFRKAGKYRLHLDKTGNRGSEVCEAARKFTIKYIA